MKGLITVFVTGIIIILVVVLFISGVQEGSMATAFVASEAQTFENHEANYTIENQVNSITSAQMIDPVVPDRLPGK